MGNRLKLDWKLESAIDRANFISTYIVQFPDLTPAEASTIADYLLWGKDGSGTPIGKDAGLETRWTKPNEAESLDAVLENPALSNAQLYALNDAVVLKKSRDVFNRDEARKEAPEHLQQTFEDLWRLIDEIELEINLYEEQTGKREKPPREELVKRFNDEEVERIRAASQKLNQYGYLKLRHRIRELRTEQFTIRDSYRSTFNITQSTYSPKDKSFVFDCDIQVLPLGIKEGKIGDLIFDENFDPAALDEGQLRTISELIWKKKQIDPNKQVFDFRELDAVYQLYLFKEEFDERLEQVEIDHIIENNLANLLETLHFYERIADLTDIQREILRLKEKKEKNTDIASYINKKYGKSYTANYISTIFKQKIIVKINEAVKLHQDTIENCFFKENFKRCTDCGRILLLDGRNWVKKTRSKDGFQSRCKRCEREMRQKKKEASN